jgi:hypothetical protein
MVQCVEQCSWAVNDRPVIIIIIGIIIGEPFYKLIIIGEPFYKLILGCIDLISAGPANFLASFSSHIVPKQLGPPDVSLPLSWHESMT